MESLVYVLLSNRGAAAVGDYLLYIVFKIVYPVFAFPVEIPRFIDEIFQICPAYLSSCGFKSFAGKGDELRAVEAGKIVAPALFFQKLDKTYAFVRPKARKYEDRPVVGILYIFVQFAFLFFSETFRIFL